MARQATGNAAGTVPQQAEYVSALFGQFCSKVRAMDDDVPLLDLGPSTTSNVMYWVRNGHPVSAVDVMAHEPGDQETRLDYPDASFGGVLGWTALSHLDANSARQLVREIGRVLRPNGWLFAVFDGDGRKAPVAQRYRIIDDQTLAFEPLTGRPEPRAVLTREVETLFQPFREVRIMVMRHGSREALGRRP
ncbi:MAG: class I SAM-dependent methyltransferase [Acidobacteriota bacterium]|jgi:SAM-dependent methyltransferase